ncbi:hypothetical protein FACS1894204_04860 [Synergistales bacterium]|nr:hypothetical protein FACS1894204_04860 [Synergistales bacterium]
MNKKICALFIAILLIFSFMDDARVPAEGASKRQRERERREQRERRERRHRREEPQRGDWEEEDESEPAQVELSGSAGEVVRIANAERRKAGLSDLRVDNELMAAAAKRASEIPRLFEHQRPDGRSWETVLTEYRVKRYNSWGENILYNSSGKATDAMTWWMKSPGHRDNILNRNYTHIGVGVYQNGGKTYFVQLFVGR